MVAAQEHKSGELSVAELFAAVYGPSRRAMTPTQIERWARSQRIKNRKILNLLVRLLSLDEGVPGANLAAVWRRQQGNHVDAG